MDVAAQNVLGTADLSEKGLDGTIERVVKKIDATKGHVYETISKNYENYVQSQGHAECLLSEVEELVEEMSEIETQAREGKLAKLMSSATERKRLAAQLGDTKATIAVLRTLCEVLSKNSRSDTKAKF